MAQFPFIGAAYKARASVLAAEQCINMYPEIGNPTAKNVMCLLGTPGKRLWKNFPGGTIRGMFRFSPTIAIVVSDSNVYSADTNGNYILLGNITGGTTPVSMASNGTVVMLVTGGAGYAITPLTGAFVQITDTDFHGADFVYFVDGYFVFNWPGTGRFQITQLYGTDVNPLDFASAEGSPDLLLSLLVDHREVWLFGETSTEVWWNSGNPDFPFERINGAYLEIGTAAKYSPAKLGSTVYWLSFNDEGQGQVMRAIGYQPERVSDHGVEYAFGQMSRIDDAVSYTYQQEGHDFYVLTFPTAQQTWAYDVTTGMWHQRAYRNPTTTGIERDRVMCQMNFAGKQLAGDHTTGDVYQLDLDYFTDNGALIPRIRATPYLSDPNYRFQQHNWLQVDMETGVGLDGVVEGTSGFDPQVILQWSDDGGKTWSNEHTASAGRIGERRRRVRWRRLGRSRARVYRVTIVEPVRVALVGASVGVKVSAA
jgi:hypothetical protein